MNHPNDKAEESRVEHADMGTREADSDPAAPTLKITRDGYWENKKGILMCLIGMVNGFQAMPGFLHDFGYQDPHLPGGYGISTTVQQLISSLVSAGMFVSTFLAGWICNKTGRRGGIWSGIALMILSVTIQIAVINKGALYAGRLILGFSNGLLMVCAQLYMQETVPANLRSLSYTFYQFWISFGALLGVIVNNETAKRLDRSSYRIPLGVLYIVPILLGIALIFMPDTPRYYASKGKLTQAERALRFHRDSCFTDLQIKEELAEINHTIEADKAMTSTVGYMEMFYKPNIKRTLTSLGVALFSAANGVPFITQYGIYFFMLSGDHNPFQTGVILQCVGLIGAMLTPFFTGRVGKRIILMVGGFLQALCMMGVGISYSVRGIDAVSGKVIIAMASIFLFVASASTSPYSWQVAGEIPSQRLRGHTLGFASSVTYLCGWSITFTIPYFINPTELNWGAQYGYIWFVGNLLICVYTFFVIPETNKRTLEEIDECYNDKVPIRKFPQHECVSTMNSRREVVRNKEVE
ncbi:uncharacterized protein HMPREF1541_05971 [Cyphellophora europaea CBS 101466]|uniref:Major facilitator superfamily (MFS) profile domain-containing protein n=1 Tax=Cyphellophora europaea (strain CBS 101466) TaxID=1220924 RepID=W2RTU4_CYPE1|nr:uncharacterized protein HMPREF1541_05971 [Cyphellophora europaea CBS 101466]ETN39745.1 hypothetical protein HMPREF1541_05971 [Cyphellophora europaea CBS 101466]